MVIIISAAICLASLLLLEFLGKKSVAKALKVITSALLVTYAINLYGQSPGYYAAFIVTALIFGAIGDVFLISKKKPMFIAGMLSFLLGHLFYVLAFLRQPFDWQQWLVSLLLLMVISYHVFRWLASSIPGKLKYGVAVYILSLITMTALGLSILVDNEQTLIGLGATLFLVSDVFVASNRFKKEQFHNRLIGLPLYYAAQFILATTIVTLHSGLHWMPV